MTTPRENGSSPPAPPSRIRVLVADDQAMVRDAVAELLSQDPAFDVVATAGTADEAVAMATEHRPDVMLVDVRMPGGGATAARCVSERLPGCSIVAMSAYDERATIIEMILAGATAYVIKDSKPEEIVEATRRAARGLASVSTHQLVGLVSDLAREISDRRLTQEALQWSEERARLLLDAAPDSAVVVDAEGRIILVNTQTEQMFRYSREELLGRPIEKLLPERFHGMHRTHLLGYLAEPRTRHLGSGLDLAGRRKDGSEFPVDISIAAIQTPEGVLGTAFVRDMSDRVHVEEVLREGEERFRGLLDAAPDAAVIVDEAGSIVFFNGQAELMFGYDREEMFGEEFGRLLPKRLRGFHLPSTQDAGHRPIGDGLELFGKRKDGTEFPVDISLSSIQTPKGVLATAFIRDVSEREGAARDLKAMEDTLRADEERRRSIEHLVKGQEEERKRIAQDIHDDALQVLAVASIRMKFVRDRVTEPESAQRLRELEESVQLVASRLRHLVFELRPRVLDADGLVPALRTYLEEIGRGGETHYELESTLTSEPVPESRVIVYRIAQEAIANSRKHSQAGTVRISIQERDGGVLLQVRDDGVGFAPEELGRSRTGHLGLASMFERAGLAGGWCKIDPVPGKGTTVEAWLPVEWETSPSSTQAPTPPAAPTEEESLLNH
jgi:PAS domain S-box-containing protein